MVLVHTTVATKADEAGAEVNKAEWNADHEIGSTSVIPNTDSTTNLGASTLRFATLHVDEILGSIINSAGNTISLTSDRVTDLDLTDYVTSPSAGEVHNFLSETHPDTVSQAVVEGSMILGNGASSWDALALDASLEMLVSNGTTLSYTTTLDTMIASGMTLDLDINTLTNVGASEIKADIISGLGILSTPVAADTFMMNDAGSLKEVSMSVLTFTSNQVSDLTDLPLEIDGAEVSGVVSTVLDVGTNALQFSDTNTDIRAVSQNLLYDVASTFRHDFRINNLVVGQFVERIGGVAKIPDRAVLW